MISLSLICQTGHEFASYFRNKATCDNMLQRGLVDCPICGNQQITYGLNRPHVQTRSSTSNLNQWDLTKPPSETDTNREMAEYETEFKKRNQEYNEWRRQIIQHLKTHAENVGHNFAEEARKIHYGESSKKDIYGRMLPQEAQELQEEGIRFAQLPFAINEQ